MVNPVQQDVITAFDAMDKACSHQANLMCLKASKALKAAGIDGFRVFAERLPANLLPLAREDRRLRNIVARLGEESANEVSISFHAAKKLLANAGTGLSFRDLAQRVLGIADSTTEQRRDDIVFRPPAFGARAYRRAAQGHDQPRTAARAQPEPHETQKPRPAPPSPPRPRAARRPRNMNLWNKLIVAASATAVLTLAASGVFGDFSVPDSPPRPNAITQKVPAGIFGP